jgi:4-amino-4-deoxy-L-arabinose transferase-like glycosyltransferase
MVIGLLLAVTWAVTLPAFQAPDEQSHFTYVQTIGERFALPGDQGRPFFSTQLSQGITAVNSDQVAAQKEVRPEWSDRGEDDWAATQATAPRDDGGGSGPASNYPPTAYAWQSLGYLAASGGTVFDALLGARLMSALWVPITVLATWLLAGEIFGRRRVLQAAAAAVPALAPMFSFVSASVSPDGMMYAIWTLALWTGVRCVRRGVPVRDAAVFIALVGLACTVKVTSYALLAPAAVLVVLGIAARRPSGLKSMLRLTAAVAIPVALTLGLWVLAASSTNRSPAAGQLAAEGGSTNWRELFSYLWQYYLPRPPFLTDYPTPPGGYPLLQVWITQGWAAFGWLEVKFEPWVYRVLGVLTMSIFGAGLLALVRARRRLDWRVVAFLGAACIALLAGLHWTDYHKLENGEPAFMQARYLFPAIGVMGLALAGAVSLAPVRIRGALAGAAVAGLLVFHVFALGLTLERFYA